MVQILLAETVAFGLWAILIPALMAMVTTTAVVMTAAGTVVVIVAVAMVGEDIEMKRLPPESSPLVADRSTVAVHAASRRWLGFCR